MTGKTHRVGGMLCCFVGYSILESKGMLVEGVNPLLQVALMYPFAIYGSVLPDLDHNADSVPSKDIVSIIINRILHLTTKSRQAKEKITKKQEKVKPFNPKDTFDARHRSWQTHSDLFLALFLILYYQVSMVMGRTLNTVISSMILQGLILGIVSHMILDMLTPEGIWSAVFVLINKILSSRKKKIKLPEKIHLVPGNEFFATDGSWEKLVRIILWCLNFVFLVKVILDASPYQIQFNYMS